MAHTSSYQFAVLDETEKFPDEEVMALYQPCTTPRITCNVSYPPVCPVNWFPGPCRLLLDKNSYETDNGFPMHYKTLC